ncbi:hypothetical protein [Geminisphaera colitermitum]|uniref:hypothetical protein n=1 Tax=Geminisphaera colitermitum TaxID=1148786 RepID=UPI0012FEB111|nr:hypothetical protein [Geminisphaera colitermitum]
MRQHDAGTAGPCIGLLNSTMVRWKSAAFPPAGTQIVPRHDTHLYCRDTITDWIDGWIEKLNDRRYGPSILSGNPGTKKASLLRSLAV